MASMQAVARRIVSTLLPDALQQVIRKAYYARLLKTLPADHEPEFTVVRCLVGPGDHVIDIGANIGVYTRYLSGLVGREGRVYSVEPVPPTFDILCSNIKRLGLSNVSPLNYAISDADGEVTMEVPLYATGGENFYRARIVTDSLSDSLRRVRVTSRRIDSLLADLPGRISFIKCDVEGHERQCVSGARSAMSQVKPAWLIEIAGEPDDMNSDASATFQLLNQAGYEAYWFDGVRLRRRQPGDRSINYFFLSTQHLWMLRECGCPACVP